jgi:aspartyl protease family protein
MARIVFMALGIICVAVFTVRMLDQTGQAPAKASAKMPPRVMTVAPAAPEPPPSNSRSLRLRASQGGHFAVEARVDGRRLEFLVDTGASQIALRASDAVRLGFRPHERDYTVKLQTANGEGRAALVDLHTVEVGDIVVRNLRALVVPDAALGMNLLGMSFLSRVRWTYERGQLVLEQ